MIVELNGRSVELPAGATVAEAVIETGAAGDGRGVAVAVDGEVVRRAQWEETKLQPGQNMEVVRAVQGG